ncbi:B12-binding domain-containing radical SAM protein [Anaerosacchariphilus polymeriproducens]|uniref:DUF4080 domain-containing protein n=1 Tax=Anaerosacchariphilus polymeriproducens TaxID=1812858 RepID=A0A371AYL8_9FIRM|nr:B12-binding domain-containing radical SAM protein [Anaerosacchariphilus polymeriproducens]RDU24570.1 DUF4080 domain-containing protein [Anaerosacchariphilus polymeriproducens]
MNFLLVAINAKYIHSNLAVYSLKAYAKEYRDSIEIAEYTINHYQEYILTEIYKKKPDVIAFSCYIWNFQYVKEIIEDLRQLFPDLPIWVGGPEVSFEVKEFLEENTAVTGVMYGEGEVIFKNLVKYYDSQQKGGYSKCLDMEQIKGIAYRNLSEQIIVNEPQALIDMSEIPFCYEDMENFQNRIVYYETSRGCPFSCSYCLSSVEKKVRFRDLDLVKQELQFFIDHKVPQVKFVDRTFNCRHSHVMEIWNYIKEHDQGITNFHFEISADLLNNEELALMKTLRPGLIQLEIGVQSTNLPTIHEINRTMDFEKLKEIVLEIKRGKNIHQHLDLIAGLPFEDYNCFTRSFDDVYRLKPEQLQLGFLKVLKGSEMYQKAKEYEIVYKIRPTYEVMYTKWLSYQELLEIKKVEEMVEVYYNSGQFETTLKLIEAAFSSPFQLYKKLGDYYEENELTGISHSRLKRYEILLDFAKAYTGADSFIYQESLLYDWYLRENSKSRPEWVSDLTEYKKEIQDFYFREVQEFSYLDKEDYQDYTARQLRKMTHIEMFHWNLLTGEKSRNYFVLFDYKNRDPLTNAAKVTQIDLMEKSES